MYGGRIIHAIVVQARERKILPRICRLGLMYASLLHAELARVPVRVHVGRTVLLLFFRAFGYYTYILY